MSVLQVVVEARRDQVQAFHRSSFRSGWQVSLVIPVERCLPDLRASSIPLWIRREKVAELKWRMGAHISPDGSTGKKAQCMVETSKTRRATSPGEGQRSREYQVYEREEEKPKHVLVAAAHAKTDERQAC
jgi:hypothetical protein